MPEDIFPKVLAECDAELKLLRQLHILAQTESLHIESQDWERLLHVVEDKKRVVQDISRVEHRVARLGIADFLRQQMFSEEQKDLLGKVKKDLAGLAEKINQVDNQNRILLEGIKAESIRASRQIQQYQKVLQSYLSNQSQIPKISQVAE
jgi:hypothetical protein